MVVSKLPSKDYTNLHIHQDYESPFFTPAYTNREIFKSNKSKVYFIVAMICL